MSNPKINDDVDMEALGDYKQRPAPYARPSRRGISKRGANRSTNIRNRLSNHQTWYMITVYGAAVEDESSLMSKFEKQAGRKIDYLQYFEDGENVNFFILGMTESQLILNFDKKIRSSDDRLLTIRRRLAKDEPLSNPQIEKLKEVLNNRLNKESRHLDLNCLFHEQQLRSMNIVIKVKFASQMALLLNTLKKICSEDEAYQIASIDLSKNQLYNLEGVKHLVSYFPNIKKVLLSNNQISHLNELSKIEDWNITNLYLDENPFCSKFDSQVTYISEIRDIFPDLDTLDSKALTPPVKFDLAKQKLPEDQGHNLSLLPNDQAKDFVGQFIFQFFKAFDEDKTQLKTLYNSNSIFTLSIPSSPRGPSLNAYFNLSRNLRTKKRVEKVSRTICGIERIVNELSTLPNTKHNTDSFVVDVTMCMPKMIAFVVEGLFQEEKVPQEVVTRAFSRSFVCILHQEPQLKMEVINDQLYIRNSTVAERKNKLISIKTKKAPSNPSVPSSLTSSEKEELVAKFSLESKMNIKFSLECLQANNWDYNKAAQDFLTKKDSIPPEAFQK